MPGRWTVILRDLADAARPIRPQDCHGLLNRWWPQPAGEHALAKPWAMNGWPEPLGDRIHHWTLSWLGGDAPPLDPEEAVGRVQRIGDHLLEPLSVTRTFDRGYADLLGTAGRRSPARSARLHTRTPVVTTARGAAGEHIPHVLPGPRRLFGSVHRSGGTVVGGSGAVGAVARFAPPRLAEPWLDLAADALERVRRSPLAGEEPRTAEYRRAGSLTVPGWQGAFRLELAAGDGRHAAAFAALLELVELTGIGRYTAQGFGAVRVDTVTPEEPGRRKAAHRARPVRPRPHTVTEEECGGLLFD